MFSDSLNAAGRPIHNQLVTYLIDILFTIKCQTKTNVVVYIPVISGFVYDRYPFVGVEIAKAALVCLNNDT